MPLRAPRGFIDESDPKVCQIGHPAPAWVVCYADLMTELVCFFVILYALSASLDKGMQEAAEQMGEIIDAKEIAGEAKLTKDGLMVSLTDGGKTANFESGFAEITPGMKETLSALAPAMRKLAYQKKQIMVQGHSDNVPIKNEYFFSNWELSSARATSVVEYLITEQDFPPACMAAVGFGQHQPECNDNTSACRSTNRRVVFLIRNQGLSKGACGDVVPPPEYAVPVSGGKAAEGP
jgi:flagellar motor protein MotB